MKNLINKFIDFLVKETHTDAQAYIQLLVYTVIYCAIYILFLVVLVAIVYTILSI